VSASSQSQAVNLISTMVEVVEAATRPNSDVPKIKSPDLESAPLHAPSAVPANPGAPVNARLDAPLDFSPDSSTLPIDWQAPDYLRHWLPSAAILVANLAIAAPVDSQTLQVRDFSKLVEQFDTPTATAAECRQLQQSRAALSECSLTVADFRHAVDLQIEYTSSVWQNN
jgi:hypothetical protein